MTLHTDGEWRWDTTGEIVSWNQWDTSMFQPYPGHGTCALVWADSDPANLWRNNPCHYSWLPLCEHEPWK